MGLWCRWPLLQPGSAPLKGLFWLIPKLKNIKCRQMLEHIPHRLSSAAPCAFCRVPAGIWVPGCGWLRRGCVRLLGDESHGDCPMSAFPWPSITHLHLGFPFTSCPSFHVQSQTAFKYRSEASVGSVLLKIDQSLHLTPKCDYLPLLDLLSAILGVPFCARW